MAIQTNEGLVSEQAGDDRMSAKVEEKAHELVSRAGESARSRIDDGKQRAAAELGSVASALRQCGTDNNSDGAILAPYVSRVADQVERISTFIDTHSVEDLARDVEHFARRNPAVFLGSCFALGVVAARFLKSSRPDLPVPYGYQQNTLSAAGYNTNYESSYATGPRTNPEMINERAYAPGAGRTREL
jgi:hypothetical protein